ncbi:pentapeptide repeat-containing protein [Nisaea acidiphila]|uniref:Pentapeptide repeat-containing protein n=1 Tax=Nisaea acidiphila TaxID=1862145 RepID=A0A9J7AUU9_9PROT|nr:pentapeptide repeat-containing protein [Nisaea acidiphila]UUX51523.1 pentapeptide repeat-containing protein [Nisaea acidiphila]
MWTEDQLREACSDSAHACRTSLYTLIAVCLYVAITAASISDVEFLTGTTIQLPILGVSVPLVPAMYFAPIVILVVHAYTLSHFIEFLRRLRLFHESLASLARADQLGMAISPFLPGQAALRHCRSGLLLTAAHFGSLLTIFLLPLATMAFHQMLHVRYQSDPLTTTHATITTLDLFIALLTAHKSYELSEKNHLINKTCLLSFYLFIALPTIYFSWVDMTPPGGSMEKTFLASTVLYVTNNFSSHEKEKKLCQTHYNGSRATKEDKEELDEAKDNNQFDPGTHSGLRCRTILLSRENIIDQIYRRSLIISRTDITPDLGSEESIVTAHDLIGRRINRSGANLRLLTLVQVDMPRAFLKGADLRYAYLDKSNLDGSVIRDGNFTDAVLQKISLRNANLSGGEFKNANLRKSILTGAELTKADLTDSTMAKADLRGANLTKAILKNTNFDRANLDFALLDKAKLDETRLTHTSLRGAEFTSVLIKPRYSARTNIRLCETDYSGARLNARTLERLRETPPGSTKCASSTLPDRGSVTETERKYTSLMFPLIFKEACDIPGLPEAIFRRYTMDKYDLVQLDMARWFKYGKCPRNTRGAGKTMSDLMPDDLILEIDWAARRNSIDYIDFTRYASDPHKKAPPTRQNIPLHFTEKIEDRPPSVLEGLPEQF